MTIIYVLLFIGALLYSHSHKSEDFFPSEEELLERSSVNKSSVNYKD